MIGSGSSCCRLAGASFCLSRVRLGRSLIELSSAAENASKEPLLRPDHGRDGHLTPGHRHSVPAGRSPRMDASSPDQGSVGQLSGLLWPACQPISLSRAAFAGLNERQSAETEFLPQDLVRIS
jgi:hypothetical protein